MNFISYILFISLPFLLGGREISKTSRNSSVSIENAALKASNKEYLVAKLKKPLKIDANWDKAQWKKIETIKIENYMGTVSAFKPTVEAKMMYDAENVYLIFRVKDKFVKSTTTKINGCVSCDSCVEFFFAPDQEEPLKYFNIEINAGGTPLLQYATQPRKKYVNLEPELINQIEIAHSLPAVIDPEISDPVTWTIEYKLPLSVLRKYSKVTNPAPGVIWKANFYKTGSRTSNPNYITWNFVDNPKPDFHLPQFFGVIKFQ
jgi:hypothetical protein